MRRKKVLAVVLSVMMTVGLMPSMAFADSPVWNDGTFEGTAQGFGGSVTVQIVVENGAITSATAPAHSGESFWDSCNVERMLQDIVTKQSADVDAASGATYSSTAVKQAAAEALGKAEQSASADADIFASGSGTAEDPYLIQNVDQLTAFAESVDNGNSYEGQTVALGADLDLSAVSSWNPIGAESGNAANLFNGTFDGAGKTVRGLKIDGNYPSETYADANVGLFSTLGGSAVVRDLTMEGVSISASSNVRLRAGAVAGDTAAGSAVVDGVSADGSITVSTDAVMGMAGGILGRMSRGTGLYNSVADVTVTSTAKGDEGFWGYAGGLTAMTGNSCSIANSAALGMVSGSAFQGGIAGMITGSLANVYTDVTLSGTAPKSGAVAGQTMASGDFVYYTGDAEPFGLVTTMGTVGTTKASSTGSSMADLLNENLSNVSAAVELKNWNVGSKGYAIPGEASDASVEDGQYVLMNIPYDEFYAAELGASDAVDAVTAATRNGKARNVNVNGASYHQSEEAVTTEGIAGAMYPVKVASLDDLKALGGKEITDADKISYELSARGQVSTINLEGAAALQESPSYSWYVLSEAPAAYKELTIADGKASFSEAKGTSVTGEATGEATIGGRHTDIEIPLSGVEVTPADVSGVVITAGEHSYALHHVVNIWRGTEIGWNLGDIDLGGGTITKIRYFLKDGTIQDYTANIPIAEAGYVLMNIPYADFYKAELGENDPAVDAVSSSTKNKTRTGTLAGGSYHQNADGSDISGVIYPVFVKDMSKLEGLTEITDASSVTISVTNRGTTSETIYSGKDALFESTDYSYYRLADKPARYKTLTIEEDGTKTFSAVSGRATTVSDATGAVNEAGHHADVEIKLSNTTGIETGQAVSGVVVTFEDGAKLGLRHVTEIWRGTELGGSAADFAGKKITNVRYYTQDSVIDFPMEISVKKKAADATAEFTDASTIQMTGLPEDLENAKATVQTQVGRGETATVIAEDAEIKDGVITATEAAENGKTYSISIRSDNYLPINTTAIYNAPHEDICPSKNFTDVNPDPDFWYHEAVDYVVSKGMMNGTGETKFAPTESTNRAMIVTVLYRLEDEPEAQPSSFTDLEAGSWYEAAVNWAAEKGIVQGMSETRFAPKDTLTRQQIATILYRYAAYKGADVNGSADLSGYTDASAVSSWAQKEMSWAVQSGLMKGTTETTLAPSGDATRAQIAVLIQRLCEEILSGIETKAE